MRRVAVAMVVVALAGCAGGAGEAPTEEPTTEPTPTGAAMLDLSGETQDYAQGVADALGVDLEVVEVDVEADQGAVVGQTPAPSEPVDDAITVEVAGQQDITVDGTFTLVDRDGFISLSDSCFGTRGYDDISEGTQVRVLDRAGTVMATASLSAGQEVDRGCEFTFTVVVPTGEDFYTFSVGRRGELSYTPEELEAAGNRVELALG